MIIDCGGKLLMPGLIDAHWHSMLADINQLRAMTSDVGYMYLTAAHEAQKPYCVALPLSEMRVALPLH